MTIRESEQTGDESIGRLFKKLEIDDLDASFNERVERISTAWTMMYLIIIIIHLNACYKFGHMARGEGGTTSLAKLIAGGNFSAPAARLIHVQNRKTQRICTFQSWGTQG